MRDRIQKFLPAERWSHFLLLLSFFVLLLTGLPILSRKMQWLSGIFGGMRAIRSWHQYTAWLFIAVVAVMILFGWRRWVSYAFRYRKEDKAFLAGYLPVFFNKKTYDDMPPQEKFNGGQKVWSLLTILGSVIMILTGLVLLYKSSFSPGLVYWSLFLHSFGALGLTAGVIGHIYLSALHPEAKESWKAMFVNGTVSHEYAASHHALWLEEEARKQPTAD